ncbi:ribosomal-protein-alanine N-acetyltransferase [Roseibium aquae]|uniref:Ribosomal-protein-alanine N-acetyltransferase n=1 Tax=Roseibium aquae TaxID=1323746 RepID=A0A916TLR8_9HYPH|nr:GNAT family protein [Roseibium aquae]GGB52261.1 ribosomal-protein-alanine N-acetyltransferase [Roseibium aquae]
MALLRASLAMDADPRVENETYYLRPPVMSDFPAWAALRAGSREFLKPWEPIWPKDDLTKAGFRRRLRRYARERREGRSHPFLLFHRRSDELLGGLTLSNIRRGVSQSVTLGYWMGAPYAGRGHMSAAVSLVLPFCFDVLNLHRVEAACLPHNHRSIRLLENAGFRREGYARSYLLIDGAWQDHLLFSCLAEDHALAVSGHAPGAGGKLKDFL